MNTLVATWDDHDFGLNDGGADYPHKLTAKQHFMNFFGLQATASGGADQAGVYQSLRLAFGELDTQLILLDTRSFRSPLKRDPDKSSCRVTDIVKETDPNATILGTRQWQWLGQQLSEPADLRLIVSSIQVIPDQHCFEKWANFPLERQRLIQLISDSKASGVILFSGDRHLAEISALDVAPLRYPLYEVTSSGLNSAVGLLPTAQFETNDHRVFDRNVTRDNFTVLMLSPDDNRELSLQIRSDAGDILQEYKLTLGELQHGTTAL